LSKVDLSSLEVDGQSQYGERVENIRALTKTELLYGRFNNLKLSGKAKMAILD
jgi:hypothetical protein